MRAEAAELVEHRQQIKTGVLIRRQMQPSALQRAQLLERRRRLAAQLQQALGVLAQQHPGGCQRALARGALKERVADFLFETANRVAHGRLRAAQPDRSTRKAAFLDHCEKGFEL